MSAEGDLTLGEKLFCVIQDIEDYMSVHNLEDDLEFNWILRQVEDIKEDYDNLTEDEKC